MKKMIDEYSGTRIFRKCGQLNIPYDVVINSPYFKKRKKEHGYCLLPYDEGRKSTVDWGKNKRPIVVGNDVPSFNEEEMLSFLGVGQENSIEDVVTQDIEAFHSEETIEEGGEKTHFTNYYERKAKLRTKAIIIHGTKCKVCGFDFSKKYGDHGKHYIEVHHNKPVSSFKEKTQINPETDMDVVCANCHRMIHRKRNNILTIGGLKNIITKQSTGPDSSPKGTPSGR
jgi:predicted HNH restriction endonuclease